jgi:hypothetical protein
MPREANAVPIQKFGEANCSQRVIEQERTTDPTKAKFIHLSYPLEENGLTLDYG